MEKKGIAWSAMAWLVLGLIILIVVIAVIWMQKGNTEGILGAIGEILRFGG